MYSISRRYRTLLEVFKGLCKLVCDSSMFKVVSVDHQDSNVTPSIKLIYMWFMISSDLQATKSGTSTSLLEKAGRTA
jgi:hypothetical protein